LGLSGVTVTLSSGNDSIVTRTDANGNYSFGDVNSDIYLSVTPALAGYTFSPPNRSLFLDEGDAGGVNFSGIGPSRVAATTHSVYLKVDNTVWAWGSNSFGQLGDGTNADKLTPVQALLP